MHLPSTPSIKKSSLLEILSEAKIGQLNLQVLVQQDVFGFKVSMHDIVSVCMFDGRKDFGEDSARIIFLKPSINS